MLLLLGVAVVKSALLFDEIVVDAIELDDAPGATLLDAADKTSDELIVLTAELCFGEALAVRTPEM